MASASGVVVAVVYFIGVLLFVPFMGVFELNTDEGINLQKARLVRAGYSLYTQVWSDQPPVLTWLLAGTQWVFGEPVVAGRVLVLVFSCLLLCALYGIVRCSVGIGAALLSAAALAMSQAYLTLSVSVMVGLPALALAMTAVWLVRIYGRSAQRRYLLASAVFMALSVMTKMFTIFLAPLLLLEIARLTRRRTARRETQARGSWRVAAVCWAGVFAAVVLAIWFGSAISYEQLVDTHFAARDIEAWREYDGSTVVPEILMQNWVLICLAVIGISMAIARRMWDAAFPLCWLIAGLIILLLHRPVWPHQCTLLTIPLAWLAGYSVLILAGLNAMRLSRRFIMILGAAGLIALGLIGVYVVPKLSRYGEGYQKDRRAEIVELVRGDRGENPWIITDDGMIAVRAGLLTPPQATVLSAKRRRSDPNFDQSIIRAMEQYQPGHILLRHDLYSPELIAYIEQRYVRMTEYRARLYYVLAAADQRDGPTLRGDDAPGDASSETQRR